MPFPPPPTPGKNTKNAAPAPPHRGLLRPDGNNPGKNAKNAAPPPRFAGPAPTATTWIPDAPGQYPAGSRFGR